MPKLEAKSGKSTDCAFKLFGRTIPVKSSADCCVDGNGNSGGYDGKNEEKGGLKRPTKVIACPRCESMDTKFCYFNNYNVNQPRHYCRKCQRYWTAGGALRNVPVGAGRRKNKPSFGIHQGHFVEVSENVWTDGQACIPLCPSMNSDKLVKVESVYPELRIFDEALNEAEAAYAQGKSKPQSHLHSYSHRLNLPSEKIVKEGSLGSEKPLCGIELPETYTHVGKRVGSGYMEKPSCSFSDKTQVSATKGESSSEVVQTVDDGACDSSLNGMVSAGPKAEPQGMRPNDFSSSSLPSFSSMGVIGNSWPLYYNGCFVNMPSGISASGSVQLKTNGVSWFPPSLVHASNWHVPSGSIWGQQWGVPWKPANTDSELKTLGKHERDEATPESKTDRSLWVPKTQRISDPGEALNSSFVESLEVERKTGSIKSGGVFKAFQSKKVKADCANTHPVDVMCANPAELSRSISSTESS
ncbi:hypothetical protein SUGI_0309540 [Cryptomeria japonica]|uniref:cyclic dof factor 2 n=1 Tax=Cryptomeria japonica TaxID=3369 RepID=UPI002408ACF6|nr:cyclic dof factor 2 [Cryptomeria japonica]GLJ17733.1 hypothetical protein SUGI_0309540 [Cryptomeria japonica]